MANIRPSLHIDFLPAEILQEVTVLLPSLRDVLSLSLVDRHVWSVLATPIIHASRVSLRGWDVNTWIEEYTMADTHPGSLLTWRKIDFLHEELETLLEQHTGTSHLIPPSGALTSMHSGEDAQKRHLSLKLVNTLTAVIRHHRLYNLNRLIHAKSNTALLSLFRPLANITFAQPTSPSIVDSLHLAERFMWLVPDLSQRALFNVASLLCSGEESNQKDTIHLHSLAEGVCMIKVFGKDIATKALLRNTFSQWGNLPRWFQGLNSLPDVGTSHLSAVEDRAVYAKRSSICAAALVLLWSHLLYSPEFPKSRYPVRPPTLPLCIAGIHREWLNLSCFPLSSLQPSEGRSWVGYYSTPMGGKLRITAPMTITLTRMPASEASGDVITFEGTGLDAIRAFRLTGTISKEGIVSAAKVYEHGPRWNWNGMVLPWALVGIWGNKNSWGGWWWIWPVDEC